MSKIAKPFTAGRSQAVRLPKEFRFGVSEVFIRQEGKQVIRTRLTLIVLLAEPLGYLLRFFFGVNIFGERQSMH